MIQHAVVPVVGSHRIECRVGRPKLISNMVPAMGHSAWCHGCKSVHLIQWEDYPPSILREIMAAINAILAREEA